MSAERYTAVFTGLFDLKKPGEYPYLAVGDGRDGTLRRGKPPAERMRREISFEDLPEDHRREVLEAYRELWGL